MDAELKAKWIAALRSGNYKQGPTELKNARLGTYCCLGVLAEVAGCSWAPSGNDADRLVASIDGKVINTQALGDPTDFGAYLSDTFAERIGLTQQHDLAEMNDNGKSFSDIADYIAQKL